MEAVQFDWFAWVILPLLIFCARVVDQSLGTLRIIFVSRSFRGIASLVGFFESLIWLVAVSQIIVNLGNWMTFIAFAGGFAMGNYVGIWLEGKLAIGLICVRIITNEDASELVDQLRSQRFGVTTVSATGASGAVRLILMILKRSDLNKVQEKVKELHPKAFMSVEDIRSVQEGSFPEERPSFYARMASVRK